MLELSSKSTSGETQFSQNLIGSHIKPDIETKPQITCVVFLSLLVLITFMPETDLQKHAITESFLQPNFRSKIWQILTKGDNLEFHKMTFCGLFIDCFIRI